MMDYRCKLSANIHNNIGKKARIFASQMGGNCAEENQHQKQKRRGFSSAAFRLVIRD